MNGRILRTFSYWCSAACLFLFTGDLATQRDSLQKELATDLSFSSRATHVAHAFGQSGLFVAHSLYAGAAGASEAAVELIPYLVETSSDVAEIVCNAVVHPIDAYEKCREKILTVATKVASYFAALDWETLHYYYRSIQSHYTRYCELPAAERGEKIGYLVGYHVMDFYGGSLLIKTFFHVKSYSCVKQLIHRKGLPTLLQIRPSERVKGFAIAVNQATRRERYVYELKHSLAEPRNTRSYGPTDYDGMRLLLDCSPLRAVGTALVYMPTTHVGVQVQVQVSV